MKSNVNASPQRSCLATSSCAVFSPTSRTPASASAPIISSGHVLGRRQHLDLRRVAPGAGACGCDGRLRLREPLAHARGVDLL